MIKENITYDEMEDKLHVETTYDAQPVLEQNKIIKSGNSSKAIQKYNGEFVHAASLHEGDVVRLINMGYNLLSPDVEEYRRALLYVQENEPHLMLVHGKPFSKQKFTWA